MNDIRIVKFGKYNSVSRCIDFCDFEELNEKAKRKFEPYIQVAYHTRYVYAIVSEYFQRGKQRKGKLAKRFYANTMSELTQQYDNTFVTRLFREKTLLKAVYGFTDVLIETNNEKLKVEIDRFFNFAKEEGTCFEIWSVYSIMRYLEKDCQFDNLTISELHTQLICHLDEIKVLLDTLGSSKTVRNKYEKIRDTVNELYVVLNG